MLKDDITATVRLSLTEDLGGEVDPNRDVTASLIDDDSTDEAAVITREAGGFCGKAWVEEIYRQLGGDTKIQWFVKDGAKIEPGEQLFVVKGKTRTLLTSERTVINFVQTLSAVATETAKYVKEVEGTNCSILDTRKTPPCMRTAMKYAVTCGGGKNNRIGLYDMYIIKARHIKANGSIAQVIEKARNLHPELKIEIEIDNLDELQQLLLKTSSL